MVRFVKKKLQDSKKNKKKLSNPKEKALDTSLDQIEKIQSKNYLLANTGALTLSALGHGLSLASLPLTAYGSESLINRGIKTVSERKIKNDLLNASIILISIGTGHYSIAAFYAWISTLGDLVISHTKSRSQKMLTEVFSIQPTKVWIVRDGIEIEIPIQQVQHGETIVVHSGEIIPVDGELVSGRALVDTHVLTGESIPVEKQTGDQVLASTLVVSGQFAMRVEKAGNETVAGKLGTILQKTSEYKSDAQIKGEYYADWAAKPVLLTGLLSAPFVGAIPALTIISSSPGNVVRTLCSLQTLSSLIYAYKHSILIKNGRVLENLIDIDTFVFDKTGTLTKDEPKVGKIYVMLPELEESDILARACTAERKVDHPIARAIISAAEEKNLQIPVADDSEYRMGYGITVRTKAGELIQVGSARFFVSEKIPISEEVNSLMEQIHANGDSLVLLAIDGQVAGILELKPHFRSEIQNTLDSLRQFKPTQFYIISGDHQNPTKKLAEEFAMDDYFYEVLPEEKGEIIKNLQSQGKKVCFIGDGINDIVAMNQADVSISMHGASTVATDTAQIVLMDGEISHIPSIMKLAYSLDKDLQDSLKVSSLVTGSLVTGAIVFHTTVVSTGIAMAMAFTWGFQRAFARLQDKKES
ncbi:MAG: heavy metal translocating P-type ATPase [Spirochaetota bacterium]